MSSNPFADPENPFKDPAIESALKSNRVDYDHNLHDEEIEIGKPGNSAYSLPESGSTPTEMQQRVDDLARRERDLEARETALKANAEHIRKFGRNNWPPKPWPYPLIFHDIDVEIPDQHKPTVTTLYRLWLSLLVVLSINLVAGILLLISGASNGGADLGAAIMYVPVIGILSFLTWYRPVYNAYMKESSVFYYIFFLFGGFHIAFVVYMLIGIPSSGSGGLINLISRFASGSIAAGVFCVLATVGWAAHGMAMLVLYKNVWAHSHGEQGHTFADAKRELQLHGFKAYLFRSASA